MSEIQVTLNPAENSSLTSVATVAYVQQQIAALQVSFDAVLSSLEVSTFAASSLTQLPSNASMALSDSVLAIIGGVPSKITAQNFLNDVGTTAQSLPLGAASIANADYFISIQSNVVCLQPAYAFANYINAQLSSATKGVVELTQATALDSSVHNNKILVCSQPIEILPGVNWVGSGITAKIVNMSTGLVTFSPSITLSSGVSSLQPGQSADLVTFTYSVGNIYFVTINGSATLSSSGITVSVPYSSGQTNVPIAVSGQAYPTSSAVQVALSTSATAMPATGWVNATASSGVYNASLTPTLAGTFYVWARLASNNAIFAISPAIIISANTLTITTQGSTVSTGVAFPVVGTVTPSGAAVIAGISQSNVTPPSFWQNATVRGTAWGIFLTSVQNGTFYVWAEQAGNTTVSAISQEFINFGSNAGVTVASATTSVLVNGSIVIAGTVGDSGATVQVALSTSNSIAPTVWSNASVVGTNWTATLTEATAGTYYVWAQEISPRSSQNVYASAITVSNPTTGVTITSFPSSQVGFTNITVTGTVSDANATVVVGLSSSNTTPPLPYTGAQGSVRYQAASVVGLNWSISLSNTLNINTLPNVSYIWAQEIAPNVGVATSVTTTTATTIPPGISIAPAIAATGTAGSLVHVAGVTSVPDWTDGNGCMYAAFSTSNSVMPPNSSFQYAGTIAETVGPFGVYLTLPSAGTYYVWLAVYDGYDSTLPGTAAYTAVSTAIVVSAGFGTVGITTFPSTATQNVAFNVGGTVGDSGATVQVGLSTSATTAPGTYYNASVVGNAWAYSITEATVGSYYLWVRETVPSLASVVSSGVVVVSAAVPPVFISSFTTPVDISSSVTVSGTCESGASIQVGLSTSNTTAPTSFNSATVTGTSWTVTFTSPSTPGNYYVWADEATPHVQNAVSSSQMIVVSADASTAVSFGSNGPNVISSGFPIPSILSIATYGAGPGVAPSTTLGFNVSCSGAPYSALVFWLPTSSGQIASLPTSLPSSGQVGVSYGTTACGTIYLLGSPVTSAGAYLAAPNVAGSYYLTTYFLNSSGGITGVTQSTEIVMQ